jgi:hypothetical protein
MVNRYGPWMDTNVVVPADSRSPDRCRVRFDWWLQADALERLLAGGGGVQQQGREGEGGRSGDDGGGAVEVEEAVAGIEFTHSGAAVLPFVRESLASSHQVQVWAQQAQAGGRYAIQWHHCISCL